MARDGFSVCLHWVGLILHVRGREKVGSSGLKSLIRTAWELDGPGWRRVCAGEPSGKARPGRPVSANVEEWSGEATSLSLSMLAKWRTLFWLLSSAALYVQREDERVCVGY